LTLILLKVGTQRLVLKWEGKMKAFKDYINVDYTQTGDTQLALNSKKRKRDGTIADEKDVDEALTLAQRLKMKSIFRKNKAKIKLGQQRARKRFATPEKLQRRAEKKARDVLTKKITKGKGKAELSFGQRQNIEKQLDKKKGAIKRIAKKLLPFIRKKDRSKFTKSVLPSTSTPTS
jgi:hypothetical protein